MKKTVIFAIALMLTAITAHAMPEAQSTIVTIEDNGTLSVESNSTKKE